jgi:hypothetical protein
MAKCYLFIGPSISREEAQRLLPGCTLLPPVAAGDLLRLPAAAGDTVGIIDGFFRQRPSVRHKEILVLLERGVRVFGASSMGALRAAELAPFGMTGVGEVYRQYASGELEADDEVALLHLPESEGSRPLTEALVNIRHNLGRAVAAGVIPPATCDQLVDYARSIPFVERTYARLLRRAESLGVPAPECEGLRAFLRDHHDDLKHRDAVALLTRLSAEVREPTAETAPTAEIHRTTWLVQWEQNALGSQTGDLFVTDQDVLAMCQVGSVSYPTFHRQVSLCALAALAAQQHGLEPPPDKLLLERFRTERSLLRTGAYQAWLSARLLTEAELVAHLRREALGALADPSALSVAALLVAQGFAESAEQYPPELSHWVSEQEQASLSPQECLARAGLRALHLTPGIRWTEPLVTALKVTGFYRAARKRFRRMTALYRRYETENPQFNPGAVSPEALTQWFSERWGSAEPFDLQLLDRGFPDFAGFARVAVRYYLYDRQYPTHMAVGPGSAAL